MTSDSLYSIISTHSENNNHKVCVKLNTSHPVYGGHFPDQPVLPGVCTLQMIRECAGMILNRNIRYKAIIQCKLTSAIMPDHRPVDIFITLGGDETLHATVKVEDTIMLKLKSIFTDV